MHIKQKQAEPDHPYKDLKLSVTQNLEREKRSVFISNIAIATDKKAILKLFKPIAKIEKMWMKSISADDPLSSQVKNKNGFVMLASKEEAESVVRELNNFLLDGRHLQVALAGRTEPEVADSICLFNLDENTDEEELRILFSDCGTITAVQVMRNKENTKCLGQAIISFKEKTAIQNAVQTNRREFRGRPINIFKASEIKTEQSNFLQASSIKNTLFAQRSAKSAPHVPKTAEEIEEDQRQMKQLLKTSDADQNGYSVAMMNNVFKHQGKVPNSKIKKRLKNLKKQNLEGSVLTKRTTEVMARAQEKFNKEYFEKDNLLKERRELRKKKKRLNAMKFKKSMKGQTSN
jgi:RNA recognition motif-containing protein